MNGVGQRVLEGEVLHRFGGQFVHGGGFAIVAVYKLVSLGSLENENTLTLENQASATKLLRINTGKSTVAKVSLEPIGTSLARLEEDDLHWN